MIHLLKAVWAEDDGQDIAEYALMLVVVLLLVLATVRLVGGNASNIFSKAASALE